MKRSINILLVLFCSKLIFAQSTLTAKQAVSTALENNFKIRIAERQQDIADKNNNWMEAGLFPSVVLGVAQSNGIQDNTNNPFTFTPGIILSQSITPNLQLNWNLFTGMSMFITKDRLEQLEEQSKGNTLAVIESTVQDVLKAYYTARLQKERMLLFEDLKKYSRERMRYYEIKEKYARSSSLELLQFQNQYLTDSTNYLLQQISYENAMRNLLLLMNNEKEPDKAAFPELTDELVITFPMLDRDQLMGEMLSDNQNLKNQFIALELQQTNTRLQRSFLYPTITFQAGVTPSKNWIREIQNDLFSADIQTLQYYGNFNLRYNLFNNFKTKRAVEVSRIQEEIAQMNIESMEQSLKTTMENLLAMYALRSTLVEISEQNLAYSTKAWEQAKRRFEAGTMTSIELEVFRNNYQNTLIQHYENQFNKMDTFLEIYRMSGKLGVNYMN